MDRTRRVTLEIGSRYPHLAKQESRRWGERFRSDPRHFLDRLVSTWPQPDRVLFQRPEIFDLFLRDLRQVFIEGNGPKLSHRNFGSIGTMASGSPTCLPKRHVTLWHGLDDVIVPPTMAWQLTQVLPCCEAHLVPGGHFVAISISDLIIARLKHHSTFGIGHTSIRLDPGSADLNGDAVTAEKLKPMCPRLGRSFTGGAIDPSCRLTC